MSEKTRTGTWKPPLAFDLVTKGNLYQYNSTMFSATRDCINGKIKANYAADIREINLRGFNGLDYSFLPSSSDPRFSQGFCVDMIFGRSADVLKHEIKA